MVDVDALLAQARRPEKTVSLCLRGDLQAEFERLDVEHAKAVSSATDSLAGNGALAIAQEMEALRDQMAESTLTVTLRALPRAEYSALVLAHPERRDEAGDPFPVDRDNGFNVETFYPALIRACVVDPELTETQWSTLLDETLSDRQFDELAYAAVGVNRGPVSVPFSPAASRTLRTSGRE